MSRVIPFRSHPITPEAGVVASFNNNISVLLEANKNIYEVMNEKGDLFYFDTIEELTQYLENRGCFTAGEKR